MKKQSGIERGKEDLDVVMTLDRVRPLGRCRAS